MGPVLWSSEFVFDGMRNYQADGSDVPNLDLSNHHC